MINTYRITQSGDRFQVYLNDTLVHTAKELSDSKRYVQNMKWNLRNRTKEPFTTTTKEYLRKEKGSL